MQCLASHSLMTLSAAQEFLQSPATYLHHGAQYPVAEVVPVAYLGAVEMAHHAYEDSVPQLP